MQQRVRHHASHIMKSPAQFFFRQFRTSPTQSYGESHRDRRKMLLDHLEKFFTTLGIETPDELAENVSVTTGREHELHRRPDECLDDAFQRRTGVAGSCFELIQQAKPFFVELSGATQTHRFK